MATLLHLLTDRRDVARTRLAEEPLAPAAPGEALLAIRRLALTTNNITYAAFGDAMRYWDFFPTGVDGWGHMPAWGFADVVASDVPGVAVGERFYGYFPVATHVKLQPVRVTERGFYDGAPHRAELVSAYNQYTRAATDPAYTPEGEDLQALLRPLFITSFVLADFLEDNDFFGAERLVVSSASSKTAYGAAWALADHLEIEPIALTSRGNRAFVDRLGCYARSVAYEDLETMDTVRPTMYVDFSGDEALRARVHRHFGPALAYDCFVGSAQNTAFARDTGLPGPAPQFFFAPPQIAKRNADWGYAEFNRRFQAGQGAFLQWVSQGPEPILRVEAHEGMASAPALVEGLARGRSDPAVGHVLKP